MDWVARCLHWAGKFGYDAVMAERKKNAPKSWLAEANDSGTDFPLTHLPYGAFVSAGGQRLCVAIGAHLLDLYACAELGLIPAELNEACRSHSLNKLMGLGRGAWAALRRGVHDLLEEDSEGRERAEGALHSIAGADLRNPVEVPNYTDFYASIHHAERVGRLFRPDQPLLPNYKHIPIGYHGRASSIVSSGAAIVRPHGQVRPVSSGDSPRFIPTAALDYELELALYMGAGNALGEPIPVARAEEHIFGVGLLNDWSARDVQSWEYQPLGPFLAKNFATTVSTWITPMAALEAFRAPAALRPDGDPAPLSYLYAKTDQERGAIAVRLEVLLATATMRENGLAPVRLTESNSKGLYWTPAQLVAHHTSNGCNLRPGDVLGTGTISGAAESAAGCLLELTRNGAEPLALPTGETRTFLEDGDEVILRGYCEAAGVVGIGLGECRDTVVKATSQHSGR